MRYETNVVTNHTCSYYCVPEDSIHSSIVIVEVEDTKETLLQKIQRSLRLNIDEIIYMRKITEFEFDTLYAECTVKATHRNPQPWLLVLKNAEVATNGD